LTACAALRLPGAADAGAFGVLIIDSQEPCRRSWKEGSMRPRTVVGCAVIFSVLASLMSVAAQEVSGVEHWVEHAGLKLYVWEKYAGSPAGKPVIVLAHGSATAGRESL